MQRIYCRFPDEATALAVATALAKAADPTLPEEWSSVALPPDGYLSSVYYNIANVPAPTEDSGEVDDEGNPIMTPVSGYFVIGLWRGPEESVPAALSAYFVEPWGAEWG